MKRTFAAALFALLTVTAPAHAATITWNVNAVTDSGFGSLPPFQNSRRHHHRVF